MEGINFIGIKIKEENKGKFTASTKAAGRNAKKWKHLDGGLILAGIIPGVGTYQDYLEFKKNPNLKNFGWMALSGLGDVLFFTGAGAGLKALKLAKAANAYRKGVKADRAAKLLNSRVNFFNTRDLKLLGILDRNIKPELQSLRQNTKNYQVAVEKAKLASKLLMDQAKNLAKKASKDIGKDVVINGALYYEQYL